MSKMFTGVIPPMITPLTGPDTLDITGVERVVEHMIGGGIHGIFLLGTTGEAPGLSYRLRRELIETAARATRGRVPLLVGITDTAFAESLALAKFSADHGCKGLVLAPPYYFPAGQDELLEYLQHIVPQLPLPLMLYNMPSMTKLVFEPKTVCAAAKIKGVVGLKDSSANMVYFHQLETRIENRDDFSLLVGPEELLGESVLMGGDGGVCGGANIAPKLYVDLYNAAIRQDLEAVRKFHNHVMTISNALYGIGRFGSSFIKGVKCAASCMGLCQDFLAEPFHRFREGERAIIKERLEQLCRQGILG